MAREIRKIYDDPNCPFSWAKVLIVDKGTEYISEYRDLFLRHGVRIQYAKSKQSVAITKQDYQKFEKLVFFHQNAIDLYLPLTNRSREWVVSLHINNDKYNDFLTKLIHILPNEAVKKSLEGEKIFADPAVKHKRPIGYDEHLLLSNVKVRHLLESGELEG
ncbi:10346_t:CDS:1 [Cetraspora pellucida]|uniref:10346_t:CDS:1 n=1 Tax=Cetraspora pellucida TaxID=1433469 RepID=A0A9N9K4C1_9GLOM|nr:10346_t:CDS:1 [Cetraspora pellucida]